MFGFISCFIRRIKAIRHVEICGNRARFIFAGNVNIYCGKGSKIVVDGGIVRLGYDLPGKMSHASHATSEITLGENAILAFCGDVCIAPGATIYVGKGAKAQFDGHNFIANSFKLICNRDFRFGRYSNTSWNVTLIDDDGHNFRRPDGRLIPALRHSLIIGDNVGIQMNVSIPRGVRVGNSSIIGGGMTVREDIPEFSLVYEEVKVKVRHGFSLGPVPD